MAGRYMILAIACSAVAEVLSAPGRPVYLAYQDSAGQYSFGYSAPDSARSEVRSSDGETRGAYSYVDASGTIHRLEYVADEVHGFKVIGTDLPRPPNPVEDTPEVVAARLEHLQALEQAEREAQIVGNEAREVGPGAEQDGSAADKSGSVGEQSGPAAERTGSDLKQAEPAMEQAGPNVEQTRPAEQSGLALEQPGPAAVQAGPGLEQSASALGQSGPAFDQTGPAPTQNELNVEQSKPAADQSGPVLQQSEPALKPTTEVVDSIKTQSPPQGLDNNRFKLAQSVPVYEISPGSLEIRAAGIQQSSIEQGQAATDGENIVDNRAKGEDLRTPGSAGSTDQSTRTSEETFATVNAVPFTSLHSTYFTYPQYFPYIHYVF